MKKIFAILSSLMLLSSLASCRGKDSQNDGSGHFFDASLSGNPKSLDPQFADDEASNTVIANLYSGLMKADNAGSPVCCNAESYTVSDDGLTYTFKLRTDNYWFFDNNDNDKVDEEEYFPVTAHDYVFALRRLLDPSMQSPYGKDYSCIRGGQAALSGRSSPDSIGVTAADDYTLVVELEYPSAEFLTLLTRSAAFPCNEEFFISTKGRYGLDDNSVMSNGAFFVRQWFYDPYGKNNILYMRKNAANSTEENRVFPSYLSFTIEKNDSAVEKRFKDNKIDCFTSLSSSSYNKKRYNVTASRSITLGLVFNPENEYFANIDLRKALSYSIDREAVQKEINSDVTMAYGIIPPAVTLLGRSYRDLSSDKAFAVYDTAQAVSLYSKAKTALGVESFDTIKLLVSTDSVNADYLHVITRQWQDILGCYIGIEEVTREEYDMRMESGDYQLALCHLTGDYNSGISVLGQFCEMSAPYGVSGAASENINELKRCADSSDLVELLSAAEQRILGEFTFIPLFYKNDYLISNSDSEDIIYNPYTGAVDYRTAKNYE